ncbi:MAG: Asp23/Gls24 family envelope stress response protein [Coriobacteriia bacterium]|nr:Asp23/Gls24 family envelope stress response protein [Coriobacteriia bacterium]
MAEQFNVDDLTIAPGVVETILALAVADVPGVARLGSPKVRDSILSSKRRPDAQGILILAESGQIYVDVHLQAYYGYQLQEVAAHVRTVVSETLSGQIGVGVAGVDVYIDGITFPE